MSKVTIISDHKGHQQHKAGQSMHAGSAKLFPHSMIMDENEKSKMNMNKKTDVNN